MRWRASRFDYFFSSGANYERAIQVLVTLRICSKSCDGLAVVRIWPPNNRYLEIWVTGPDGLQILRGGFLAEFEAWGLEFFVRSGTWILRPVALFWPCFWLGTVAGGKEPPQFGIRHSSSIAWKKPRSSGASMDAAERA